jgi:hypothetical protein
MAKECPHGRETRVLEIRDPPGKIHGPPFSYKVSLAINRGQRIFRIECDGMVVDQNYCNPQPRNDFNYEGGQ